MNTTLFYGLHQSVAKYKLQPNANDLFTEIYQITKAAAGVN